MLRRRSASAATAALTARSGPLASACPKFPRPPLARAVRRSATSSPGKAGCCARYSVSDRTMAVMNRCAVCHGFSLRPGACHDAGLPARAVSCRKTLSLLRVGLSTRTGFQSPRRYRSRKNPSGMPAFARPLKRFMPAGFVPGRDARFRAPPGQFRASPIRALGSYLGCLTAKRTLGQGCRTRGGAAG
jgi:hypothetical protein